MNSLGEKLAVSYSTRWVFCPNWQWPSDCELTTPT